MEPGSNLDLGSGPERLPRGAAPQRLGTRAGARLVLWLHRQAERADRVPSEFGDETPVDRADARAVAREWLRQARLWAAYNPEQMFALKVGLTALGLALLVLILLVGAIR